MPRYYFHAEDGRPLPDEAGTELPDLAAVRRTALTTLTEMAHALRAELWRHRSLRITVTDEAGLTLMSLDLVATFSAAVSRADQSQAE